MPQDEALVAFVDLRRIMDRHAATFHTQILRALTSRSPEGGPHSKRRETGHSEQLMLLVDLFRANVHIDFKRWEESWLTGPNETANPKSPLQCTGILHLHFATLVILSLPLRSTSERPTQDFDALRRDCYGAAIGFLSAFVDRSERGLLPCVTNAIAVSAGELARDRNAYLKLVGRPLTIRLFDIHCSLLFDFRAEAVRPEPGRRTFHQHGPSHQAGKEPRP